MHLGDGAANFRRDASGRRRIGVVTSFFATLPMLQGGLATLAVLEPAFFTPGETLTNSCKLRYWLRIDHVLTRCSSACVRQLPHLSINDHLPTKINVVKIGESDFSARNIEKHWEGRGQG